MQHGSCEQFTHDLLYPVLSGDARVSASMLIIHHSSQEPGTGLGKRKKKCFSSWEKHFELLASASLNSELAEDARRQPSERDSDLQFARVHPPSPGCPEVGVRGGERSRLLLWKLKNTLGELRKSRSGI